MSFITENPHEESIDDAVEKEFDKLNDEVVHLTNGKAKVVFSEMSEEQVRTYFKESKEESYFVDLKYSLTKDGVLHRFRNRFACVSYNATLPAVVKNLLLEDSEEKICENDIELQNFIKEVANSKSFHRSLHRAGWKT